MALRSELSQHIPQEDLARMILQAGAVDIRDVDAGEEPFLYSSGNYGPGYVDIKGQVGRQQLFKTLTGQLALTIVERQIPFDFLIGNATGGLAPTYQVREDLQEITGRRIPFGYARNTRKLGGHQEYLTGVLNNPEILEGSTALIGEELVNFAQTTNNSAIVARENGFKVTDGICILDYKNPAAAEALANNGMSLTSVIELPTVLAVAEADKTFTPQAIAGYREFLANPKAWMDTRGIKRLNLGNE